MYGYLEVLGLIVVVGFGLGLSLGFFKFGTQRPPLPGFVYPERETDMWIVVRSSDERALHELLAEFGSTYGASDFGSTGVALNRVDGRLVVRFPRGLPSDLFLYLVNFLHYPFEGTGFAEAYGLVSLDPLGEVVVFVPGVDDERDAVWLRSAADETWRVSFHAGLTPERVSARGSAYRDYWRP